MKRRECVISTTSLFALSGCLGLGETNEENRISVADSSLAIDDISCQSSLEEQATVSVSGSQITVKGIFPATRECTDLALSIKTGIDQQTTGHIDAEIEERQTTAADCHSCVPKLGYTGTVDVSQQPIQITVQHFPLTGEPTQPAQWRQSTDQS